MSIKGITEQELPHFKAIEYHKLENTNIGTGSVE